MITLMLKKVFFILFGIFLLLIALFPYCKWGFFCFIFLEVMYFFYPLLLLLLPLVLFLCIKQKYLKFQYIVLAFSFLPFLSVLSDKVLNLLDNSYLTVDYLIYLPVLLFVYLLYSLFYFLNIKQNTRYNCIFVLLFFVFILMDFWGVI